ncbi:hypothetical protein MALV_54970 [Mycolicibacterium alvei]|uniref:Transposase IS4-like domain-containing protein n=1 Tax=Mycolicibacterium alvei TaxID=67081 RepID=A0A6N4V3M6_9MYCO|nr:hypothetical protein MALV_54970 [Mycolicibacterium alvei]
MFGAYGVGETTYAPTLLRCLKPDMLLLADRNFAVTARGKDRLDPCRVADPLQRRPCAAPIKTLADRTWLARMGAVTVRVIDARISVRLDGGATRYGHYRLVTTLLDEKQYPADELVELYHQRWEIETSYLELKSTILADECCARVPPPASPKRSTHC